MRRSPALCLAVALALAVGACAGDSGGGSGSGGGTGDGTGGIPTQLTCDNECTVGGSRQCTEAGAVQICGEYDGDGCLEWGAEQACLSGTVCLNGFCSLACDAECTVQGARQCAAGEGPPGVQTCQDGDFDGCLEWSDPTACPAGQVCSNGNCSAECADECSAAGARKCSGAAGVAVCEQGSSGCLVWGAVTQCAASDVCSNGFCASDCSNECTANGATKCEGDAIAACGDSNGDGCLEWGTPLACADGLVCSNGFCSTTCTDECDVKGLTTCDGNGWKSCGDADADGCLEWGTVTPCDPGLSCSSGKCSSDCTDECSVIGARQCFGSGVQICGDGDSDACLEWGTPQACDPGLTCSGGFCATECTDECSVAGAKQCNGDGFEVCSDYNLDGCLEWGAFSGCASGQSCSGGSCSEECTDECSVIGGKQCAGDAVQVCDNTDADPCLEWGTAVPCGAGASCSGGFCGSGCSDECSVVGSKQCSGEGFQICDQHDSDPCLDWGTVVACSDGQSCSVGNCSEDCVDECSVAGSKQCSGAGTGTQVCADTDSDSCLEWGTPVLCGDGQTCSDGACAIGCTDECTVIGSKQCSGAAAHETCDDWDSDGCLEWGVAVACGGGEVCSAGSCALGCTDECTVKGARQCASGIAWQQCDDWDTDGCLEWGEATSCPAGVVCAAGSCALDCIDECPAIGSKQCNIAATGLQSCDDWDQDGCLEWSDDVACADGDTCSGGNCAMGCIDECGGQGLTQCAGAGAGVQTCADYTQDGCLQWGTPASCGDAGLCVDGACQDVAVPGTVRINEVLYDAVGADDTAWVELRGDAGLDLTGFVLRGINGANGQPYNAIPLSGSIGADGYYLVATSTSEAAVLAEADLIDDAADYQNGPDSIELLWGGAAVDALGYGEFTVEVFQGEGEAAPDVAEGHSLGRDAAGTDTDSNLADFLDLAQPTPGAPNAAGNEAPVAQLTCPGGGGAGEALSFSGQGSSDADGSIASYAFAFGDGSVLSGPAANVSHIYGAADTYTVTLTVTDNGGAQATDTCVVALSDPDAPQVTWVKPVVDLTLTQGDVVAITVDASPAPGRTIAQAELVVDGLATGQIDDVVPFTFTYVVPDGAATGGVISLTVTATDNLGATGSSGVRHLLIHNDPPSADFTAVITGNQKVTVDASGSSDSETAPGALQFRWDWESDGIWDTEWAADATADHVYGTDGEFTISMEVIDEVDQSDTAQRSVNFQSVQDLSGAITSTTWFGTINITGDTWVPAGHTLIIAPATTVVMVEVDQNNDNVGDYDLVINGTLIVEGTEEDPVVFTTLDSDGTANTRSWNTVQLAAGSSGHVIDHAVFEWADIGLDIRGGSPKLSHIETRFNRLGVYVGGSAGTVTLDSLNTHDNDEDGLLIDGATVVSTTLGSRFNGRHGVLINNSKTHAFDQALVSDNAGVGVYYRGNSGGTLTHSQIHDNGLEGVRALVWDGQNPTPSIRHNNIHSNAVTGNLVLHTSTVVSVSTTSSQWSYDPFYSSYWTPPGGGKVLLAETQYSESGSGLQVVSGTLEGSGMSPLAFTSNSSRTWRSLSATGAANLRGRIDDETSSGGGNLQVFGAAYEGPSSNKQIAVVLNTGTVDARFNYLGAWPDVLAAVTYESPSDIDIQGFVGVPLDKDTWDTTIYQGGETLTADEVWDRDMFVVGDVVVGSGATLTIEAGVTITFVPTDQDHDNEGDWSIDRGAGHIVLDGAAGAEVLLTTLGDVPSGGGFPWLDGTGGGTTTATHAIFETSRCGVRATAGVVLLTNVEIRDVFQCGLQIGGSASLTSDELLLHDIVGDGAELTSAGALTFDHLTCTDNGEWCLDYSGPKHPSNAVTNATVTGNLAGGIRLRDADVDVTQSNVKFNGVGLWLEGSSAGIVSANNVLFNAREGVIASVYSGQQPTSKLNGNNIFGNSSQEALWLDAINLTKSTSSSAWSYDTYYSSVWSAPGAAEVALMKTVYSESGSGLQVVSGGVRSQSNNVLVAFTSNSSTTWRDLWGQGVTGLQAFMDDETSSGGGSVTVQKVLYFTGTDDPIRTTELTVARNSGVFDATGNHWGVFPNVQDVVLEVEAGTVDYTGFKSIEVSGAGPQ